MSTQPEATELAEVLESYRMPSMDVRVLAAAELRRLAAVEAQRDALLAALKELMEYAGIIEERCDTVATNKARAAIKAAEEGK